MKGTKDFIIQVKPYSETFKTESGVELYGNVDFTAERLSNRVAKVIGTPGLFESDIKEGYEVLIDASMLYRQIYNGTKQWYQNVVDEDKEIFHLDKELIVCYRKNADSDWIGFLENSLVQPLMEETKINTTLILPANVSQKKFTGKVTMTYSNTELNELGVVNGDTLHINKLGGIKYWLNGEEYHWVRNKDIYAISLNKQVALNGNTQIEYEL